jgi:hypothetical protein
VDAVIYSYTHRHTDRNGYANRDRYTVNHVDTIIDSYQNTDVVTDAHVDAVADDIVDTKQDIDIKYHAHTIADIRQLGAQ